MLFSKVMKLIIRLIIVICIFILTTVLVGVVYFNNYGKDFFQKSLTEILKKDVKFDQIIFESPFTFHFINFSVDSFFSANRLDISPNLESLFGKNILIDSLVIWGIDVDVDLKDSNIRNSAQEDLEKERGYHQGKTRDVEKVVIVKNLRIEGGQIHYGNYRYNNKLDFKLINCRLDAKDVSLPRIDRNISFTLSGILHDVREELEGGHILSEGWINWENRSSDLNLSVTSTEKKNVLSARLKSKDNDLTVEGKIVLNNFGIKIKNKDGDNKVIKNILSGVLSKVGIDVNASFSFDTQLDDFQITNVSFKGGINIPDIL